MHRVMEVMYRLRGRLEEEIFERGNGEDFSSNVEGVDEMWRWWKEELRKLKGVIP